MQPAAASPPQGLRRGPPLSVQTDVRPTNQSSPELPLPPLPGQSKPLRADTAPYDKSPDPNDAAVAERAASRRQSRLNFKLFNRGKSTKKFNGQLPTADEEREAESPEPPEETSRAASIEQMLRPQPSLPKVKPSKSAKSSRAASVTETPPLFQAYPQAVLEGHLTAPTLDAETVIRMRYRQIAEAAEMSPSCAADGSELSPTGENRQGRNKINKRRTSTNTPAVTCASKIYILTTSGWLLQYAEEGCHNRFPERVMQLGKDSAAFASDAIPGKHWVLHISQSATEEGALLEQPKTSVLSKLSFGSDMKKPVSNFLLVMNSAEEMSSWLVTIRKEIQSLGGIEYRPDEKAAGARSQQQPPRHIELDSSPMSGQRKLGHRASMDCMSPPGAGMPPNNGFSRPRMGDRKISTGSTLSHRASMYAISPTGKYHPQQDYFSPLRFDVDSIPITRARTFDLDKALPARPSGVNEEQARIDALGIRSHSHPQQTQLSSHDDDATANRRGPLSPKFPISSYNRDARKYSEESVTVDPEGARLRRFSWEKSSRASNSPPQPASRTSHDTNATGRTRTISSTCPSLTDGESVPQGSVAGDVSSQEHLMTRTASQQDGNPSASPALSSSMTGSIHSQRKQSDESSIASAHPAPAQVDPLAEQLSKGRRESPEKLNLPSPTAPLIVSQDATPLEEPSTAIHLQHSPYPLPKSNLPIFATEITPPARPSSAQDHTKRPDSSKSRPVPPRRPSSCQPPTSPVANPSLSMARSCGLLVDKPLTLQERRRLTHLPIDVVGPPPLPPPTSPLPALPPMAHGPRDQPSNNEASALNSEETQLHEDSPSLAAGSSPESPPTLAVPPPPAKPAATSPGHSPQIYQDEEFHDKSIPLSPVSESWKLYLDRIGAS